MNSDILEALDGVGFDENEALIYLTVLELGSASAWDIAQKSGIKRPTCYVILDNLVFKGFASKTDDGRRTIYSVISPKQLLLRVQRRQERLTATLSQLEALSTQSAQKPAIRLFEGADGVEQAYSLSLDLPRDSELLIYGTASVERLLPDFIPGYIRDRIKRGIRVRAILPDTPENRAVVPRDPQELRQTRFLPAERFNPNLEINQFGDFIVYIAHSERTPFATVIENAALAAVERQRFDLIWDLASRMENDRPAGLHKYQKPGRMGAWKRSNLMTIVIS